MPSQQLSLSGRRTVLMCQVCMASMLASSVGPSKTLFTVAVEHMYSVPARLTPSRRTVLPAPSTSWLPRTVSAFAERPVEPAAPLVPAAPILPAAPLVPAAPVVPAVPALPAAPVVPAMPALPAVPALPAEPVVPPASDGAVGAAAQPYAASDAARARANRTDHGTE